VQRVTREATVAGGAAEGTTIGVAGGRWRGTVTPWGAVVPWDGSAVLDWWVASEERWHTPAQEPSIRQQLLRDVPVVETALRVPGGDAVHRAFAVATTGGLTVVEIENRSSRTFAVAFSRPDVRTGRPIARVAPEGVDVPAGAWVSPVAHGASIRIALAHDGSGAGPLPLDLPSADQVSKGWQQQIAGRLHVTMRDVPPPVRAARLRAALVLEGPGDPATDPAAFLLAARELAEMGLDADAFADHAATAVEALARRHRSDPALPWEADGALEAAPVLFERAGDSRAARDAVAVRRRMPAGDMAPETAPAAGGALALAWLRRHVAVSDRTGEGVDLLPHPMPQSWLGRDLDVRGVHTPGGGAVSYAVRWHGQRPALLWESQGLHLRCSGLDPRWSSDRGRGEVLLPAIPPEEMSPSSDS
jgi:hypothetical protein